MSNIELPKLPYRYIVITGEVAVPDTFVNRLRSCPNVEVRFMEQEQYEANAALLLYGTQRVVKLVRVTDPGMATKALTVFSDSLAEQSGMVLPLGVELDIVVRRALDKHAPYSPNSVAVGDDLGSANKDFRAPLQLLTTQLGQTLLKDGDELDVGAKLTWEQIETIYETEKPTVFHENQIVRFITAVRESHPDMVALYTQGQCYNFYKMLKSLWPNAVAYYDQIEGHVYTRIGDHYYDIRGLHFRAAVPSHLEALDNLQLSDSPELWGGRDTRRLVETVRHVGGELYEFTYVKIYENDRASAERRYQVPASNLFNALVALGRNFPDDDRDDTHTLDVTSFKKVR